MEPAVQVEGRLGGLSPAQKPARTALGQPGLVVELVSCFACAGSHFFLMASGLASRVSPNGLGYLRLSCLVFSGWHFGEEWHRPHVCSRAALAVSRYGAASHSQLRGDQRVEEQACQGTDCSCALAEFNPSGTAAKIAGRISGLELQPMAGSSAFVKPESVKFQMDGEQAYACCVASTQAFADLLHRQT